jgi:branched-chain amino acid transport system ATP-binding protein
LAGSVTVLGKSSNKISPQALAREGLTHVAEQGNLFPSLTVDENLRLALPKSRSARAEALKFTFATFPALEGLKSRAAGLLSGGEQQMLAMAQAMAPRPSLMLIDELSLGLAPVIVEQLLPTVRKAADETGCAVVLVEQHIPMALEVVDRAYVLGQGRIQLSGTASELSESRSLLESSYLGEDVEIKKEGRVN